MMRTKAEADRVLQYLNNSLDIFYDYFFNNKTKVKTFQKCKTKIR